MNEQTGKRARGPAGKVAAGQELEHLRELLLGQDYQALLELKRQLGNPERFSRQLAGVISEALSLRIARDSSVSSVLAPTIERALSESVARDPGHLADALYPVMGPAIRKSINEVLSQTLQTFNQLLEESLSVRSLLWRFDAWRTGRSYSEVVLMKTLVYQVEQVFLIHRETGLLLQHVVSEQAITKDPDMVSGMLTAIQDFVNDSFEVRNGDSLSTLKLGDLTVHVEQGPHAVLAAVVRGNPPASFPALLRDTQEDLHRQMSHSLQTFTGDSEPFLRIRPLLERCLILQTQREKEGRRTPWLLYLLLAGVMAGLGWWGYQAYQERRQWQAAIEHLGAEPGIVVTGVQQRDGVYRIEGLRDPLARAPAQVLQESLASPPPADYVFSTYVSLDEPLVRARLLRALEPPPGVTLDYADGRLQVTGRAPLPWAERFRQSWPLVGGIQAVDESGLTVFDAGAERALAQQAALERQFETLQRELGAEAVWFEVGETGLPPGEPGLEQARVLAGKLRELVRMANRLDHQLVVYLSGNTDESGTLAFNQTVARKRVTVVKTALIELGLPEFLFQPDNGDQSRRQERSVRARVVVF